MNRILLAGGGSLGPVSPLVAIAQRFPEADYLFLTTRRGPERGFLTSLHFRIKPILSGKLRRYYSWRNIIDVFNVIIGFFQALSVIIRYRPDVILTSGGYVAVPVAIAGKMSGVPVFVHQQDIEIGLANKIMARFADTVTVTFSELAAYFPHSKTVVTGNPVRKLDKSEADSAPNAILILGGSQGARSMNSFINKMIPSWTQHTRVIHVLGQNNFDQRLDLTDNYEPHRFITDGMGALMRQAKIVVTRGGLSTLSELAFLRKPTVIVALPDSHQLSNANFFARHNAAISVTQGDFSALKQEVERLLTSPKHAQTIGDNMNRLFNPNAAEEYVALVKSKMRLNISAKPTIFIAGIGGIGSSALAQHLIQSGYKIVGSELSPNQITAALEQFGAKIYEGHDATHIPTDTSVLIHSSALAANNPEILEAKRREIPVYTYNEYLGKISEQYRTVAISGTNGKTTTTGMAGVMAIKSGLDPTVIVGGLIPQFNATIGNYYQGHSDLFIVEACEFRSHMLNITPKVIVVTNIEEDHMDYYRDLHHIQTQFQKFVDKLPDDGVLIRNADDPNMLYLATSRQQISYGTGASADFRAIDITEHDGLPEYELIVRGKSRGRIKLNVHGKFNVLNSLAVFALADYLHADPTKAARAIEDFSGSWRRFEKIGEMSGTPVYSDYAHHPTAIETIIQAAKTFYPKRRIFVIFQPHTYNRTEKMFDRFVQSFSNADKVIIMSTYEAAGRVDGDSSTDIAKTLAAQIRVPNTEYIASFDDVATSIQRRIGNDDVLLFLGAGNIDIYARKFVNNDKYR